MKQAASSLPVHREGPSRQIKFEQPQSSSVHESISRFWKELVRKVVSASTGSPSDGLGEGSESVTNSVTQFIAAQAQASAENGGADWMIDEVVVHADDSDEHHGMGSEKDTTTRQSESGGGSVRERPNRTDSDQYYYGPQRLWSWYIKQVWYRIVFFFHPTFDDKEQEVEFRKLLWYQSKPAAFYISLYLVLNWVLYLILNHSVTRYEQIVYYGGLTLLTVPVPFMIGANYPSRYPIFFQLWFCAAVWYCGMSELIQIKQCHFFDKANNKCFGKDFLAMSYYSTALPALGMFIVSQRIYNFLAQVIFFILLITLVIPDQGIYARNVVSFVIFSAFLQYLHFSRDMSERRMFSLNSQLKLAYRAQQKAQQAESKASQNKRRFSSYIFHEVRVPLNTAMLAYQNLHAHNAFQVEQLKELDVEVHALEASLSMMQQVLNDVLDLQKMDAGHFESSPRPFPLHRAIKSMLGPVGVATNAKGLELVTDLDERIDQVLGPHVAPDGVWVIGDEIRIRQVLTNLASNAVKFTPDGAGPIKVTTRLLSPLPRDSGVAAESPAHEKTSPLVNAPEAKPDHLVFRLEVLDSGPGIKPSDLVENRLFQPFVQTNIGKMSGKGSGLGLAIVRQIVSLSGGRLGVKSRKGQGAEFWVEWSLPLATAADVQAQQNSPSVPAPSATTAIRPPLAVHSCKAPAALTSGDNDPPFPPTIPPVDLHKAPSPTSPSLPGYDTETPVTLPPPSMHAPSHSFGPPATIPTTAPPPGTLPVPSVDLPSAAADSEPMRVLVVDDDPLTRQLMSRMLSKLGCVVDTANDGQECLDILLGPHPSGGPPSTYDLISLDNMMPVKTGEETVRHLRAMDRTDLVVGCTGNALTEDQTSYIKAGVDRVLTKPIMLKDLKAVLQVALQRRKEKRGLETASTS